METRETLEAALAASWDRDTLAVYADYLLAEGDPRGELIALDLQIEATGNSVELSKRRTSLLFGWLGGLVPVDNVHAAWVGDSLRFGFVEELVFRGSEANAIARLEQTLASPAGPYVRSLSLHGTSEELGAALAVIARDEHAWLTRLSLTGAPSASLAPAITAAAYGAMPRLHTLELRGLVGWLSHPRIAKLVLVGRDTITGLGDGAVFESVVELAAVMRQEGELADYDEFDPESVVEIRNPFQEIALPSLRRLDLSRIDELGPAFELLRAIPARTHVTQLVISRLRSASDRNDLVGAIRDMRSLETIEVAHGSHYDPPDIPKVTLVRAERWPWPTQERVHDAALRIRMPGAKYGDTVALIDAVYVMEQAYETLPRPARDAWSQLWRCVAALTTGTAEFPACVLADAVESYPALMQNGWRELREELSTRRPFAADAMLTIERCPI